MTTDSSPTRSQALVRAVLSSAWFHLVAAIIVTGLVLSFVAKPYWVPSGSMQTTLEPGDRILVNRLAYLGADPGTGHIIVFDADEAWESVTSADPNPLTSALRWVGEVTGFGPSSAHTLVKRVIGIPGHTVACCTDAGALTINDVPVSEPYVSNDFAFELGTLDCHTTPRSQRCFDAVTVPPNSYLVLGDNRAGSADSAVLCRTSDTDDDCWRWATDDGVVGKATLILWPIARWSGL